MNLYTLLYEEPYVTGLNTPTKVLRWMFIEKSFN